MDVELRQSVLTMPRYTPGKPLSEFKREYGIEHAIKLASNENPLGPSPLAVAALEECISQVHYYPDAAAYELRHALSERFNVAASQIVIGAGSDELLHLLGVVLLDGPEHEVIVGSPSFMRYDSVAAVTGAKLTKVPLDAQARHDLPAMAAAVSDKTRLIFIANPNNPTGTIVGRREVAQFLKDVPSHIAIVLDEAYYEFAIHDSNYGHSLEWLAEHPNLIGLRTFSKAYGLAGLRVGYGFANERIIDALERTRGPFNVSGPAQAAAIAALRDTNHLQRTLEVNAAGKPIVAEALSKAGYEVAASWANFVYGWNGPDPEAMAQRLLYEGVIVRAGRALGAPGGIRVSIGTEAEVAKFAEAIAKCVKEPALP